MSSKTKNTPLFALVLTLFIFNFYSKLVFASKASSNPSNASALDSRPIFDIFLDVDGTIVFGYEGAVEIPKSLESFKIGIKTFIVTPYFKDFILSLVNDTKTHYRITYSTGRDSARVKEILMNIDLGEGRNALSVAENRVLSLDEDGAGIKSIELFNPKFKTKTPLNPQRALAFDDEEGWMEMFSHLVHMKKNRADLFLNGHKEVEKLRLSGKSEEATKLETLLERDRNMWLSARGLIEHLVEENKTLVSYTGDADIFQLTSKIDFEEWSQRGAEIMQKNNPNFKRIESNPCTILLGILPSLF
ncbi:MAG: hypothetical protein KA116_06055 [Proteobacteria bacterium]|nr:hypothetical protein [Pseudomonadota bacterium]